MLQEERYNFILQQIGLRNKVVASELSQQLHVSLDTVRRDIKELEKTGKLTKVHGGAISLDFHQPFQQQEVYAHQEKMEIARKALSLIKDGMSILAGGGTVMLELARIIPEDLTGTLYTVSPLVALEAAQRSSVDVILLSGHVSRNSYICTGASVVSQISELHIDLCLLGTNGLSIDHGVTDHDWEVAQVKKAILRASRQRAILCIAEKLQSVQKVQVCNLNEIHHLITGLSADDEKLAAYGEFCKTI
jgi:DeoR/GlpR family transcriptional regulator of sugar metabolism